MATKRLQILTELLSEEKVLQLIQEQLSQFVVIGSAEPENGPVLWIDTGYLENKSNTVLLSLGTEDDESDVIAIIDGVSYPVLNAGSPIETDDESTYVIEISQNNV